MAAKQKLDKLKISFPVGEGANVTTYDFFFMGQKESYADLALSEAECGVDEPTATELKANLPMVTVGSLIRSGNAVRMRASGKNSSSGKTVTRNIIVARTRVGTALAAVNDGTKPIVDGAELTLVQPTRRRLV